MKVVAIDQRTTGTKSFTLDETGCFKSKAKSEFTPRGNRFSIDGRLAARLYFNRFLANAQQKTLIVQNSAELTGLGTARVAMRGAGAKTMPPLPAPRAKFAPEAQLSQELKQRFSDAVNRAKNWK